MLREVPYDPSASRDLARVRVAYHAAELARAEAELHRLEAAVVPTTLAELPADVIIMIAKNRRSRAALRMTCRRLACILKYGTVYTYYDNFERVMRAPRDYLRDDAVLVMCWRSSTLLSDKRTARLLTAFRPASIKVVNSPRVPHNAEHPQDDPARVLASVDTLAIGAGTPTSLLFRIIDRTAARNLHLYSPTDLFLQGQVAFFRITHLQLDSIVKTKAPLRFANTVRMNTATFICLLCSTNLHDSTLDVYAGGASRVRDARAVQLRFPGVVARIPEDAMQRLGGFFPTPPIPADIPDGPWYHLGISSP